ncbi:hypothetical protein [Streptomyces sp. NPDC090112]|uniref:hypothetical protein n=1 Tax=Streptomyces sp. NPDC090112 TaxID=3365949 RepID=UPI0038296187
MTPTQTRTRTPLDVAQGMPTGPLLDRLLTLVQENHGGAPNVVQIAAAAAVLQQRYERPVRPRLAPENLATPLIEKVRQADGFLAVSTEVVRRLIVPVMRAEHRVAEQDPKGGHKVRTRMEILTDNGLGVFPGPALPAGAMYTVVYEQELLLGQLLTALTAGEDVAVLLEEVTAAAAR